MSDNLILYIRESIKKSGIYYLNGEIPVWADDPLPDHINLNEKNKDQKQRANIDFS